MNLTKSDLELVSHLIFDSCITSEFEFSGVFFLFKTLSTDERNSIELKFRHKTHKQNIVLVVNILTYSIVCIDGDVVDKKELEFKLWRMNSIIILKLYEFYQQLDKKVIEVSQFVDYYIESKESRSHWTVFKTCERTNNLFSLKKLNNYQYYWIVMNVFKDQLEEEKKLWGKVEYMTNSICAFVNPKAYNKVKGQIGVSEQFEKYENKDKQAIVEKLEKGESVSSSEQNTKKDIFSSLQQLPGETEEQHIVRVDQMMHKCMSGEDVDEYDKVIRETEMNNLYEELIEKRQKICIEKEAYRRLGTSKDVLENERSINENKELSTKGYFFEDVSYFEIVNKKDYMGLNKKYKQEIFDKAMSAQFDLEKEIVMLLKKLSSFFGVNESNVEHQDDMKQCDIIDLTSKHVSQSQADISKVENVVYKNAAEQAANMNIDVKSVDLIQQKKEKINRVFDVLEQRKNNINNSLEDDEETDVMRFV